MSLPFIRERGPTLEELGHMQNGGHVPGGWSVEVTELNDDNGAGIVVFKVHDEAGNFRGEVVESWNPAGTRVTFTPHARPDDNYRSWVSNIGTKLHDTATEAIDHVLAQVKFIATPRADLEEMLADEGELAVNNGIVEGTVTKLL